MTPREQAKQLATTLHGWTSMEKAEALFDLVEKTKPKLIMEIGVWAGKSLFAMALAAKQNNNGCMLLAVDPWSPEDSAAGQTEPASEQWWRVQNHQDIFNQFKWHAEKLGLKDMIEIHRVPSRDMAPIKELDILHIDGNHGPDAPADAERLVPGVKLGGYVVLDDLRWAGGYVLAAERYLLSVGFHKVSGSEDWGIYRRIEMGAPQIADKPETAASPLIKTVSVEEAFDSQLTVAYITSRKQPLVRWFLESLQNTDLKPRRIIIVSLYDLPEDDNTAVSEARLKFADVAVASPKPNVWQGKDRITPADWWAVSNARNTAICMCKTEWLACLDDRCVIMPGYADAVRDAMKGQYVMAGSYQKRHGMKVQGGLIMHGGIIVGDDSRLKSHPGGLMQAPAEWTFGCNLAFPIAWALEINGFEELCDGMGMEDCFFGRMMANCGHTIRFDPRARVIQDRTPGELGDAMLRRDKGKSPDDKSHAAVRKFSQCKRAMHCWDLPRVREHFLEVGEWPSPLDQAAPDKWVDWYDQQPIKDFAMP